MRIAIASGKGGTGKTTIATGLAHTLARDHSVWYKDCDVEAPNGHLFFSLDLDQNSEAVTRIPEIDDRKCTACGKCVEVCQFHALAKIASTILVFPQLCHGCGSCTWNCPHGAITELPHPIGLLEFGNTPDGIVYSRGTLTISEPMPTPVIRQLKQKVAANKTEITILDAPPGASCSVVETLRSSDYIILVTEPTPFGLHDLKQMVGILNDMHIPAGLIINRQKQEYPPLEAYCLDNGLPVLMRIPFDRKFAEGIASGKLLTEIDPGYVHLFSDLFEGIENSLQKEGDDAAIGKTR